MSNKTEQTAIDTFIARLRHLGYLGVDDSPRVRQAIKQAKEMEKQQMWEYIKNNYCIGYRSLEFHRLEFEHYYNETYGGNK